MGGVPSKESALNEHDIRRFVEADYARLVNAMAMVSGDLAAAEDAVQEALVRAWEASEKGQHIESLPAWVAATARNLLTDRFRRLIREMRARRRLASAVDGPGFAGIEERTDLGRALGQLPPRRRDVAIFYYYLDLNIAEISRALRISEGTVKSSLHRARQALAMALADDNEEVDDVAHR
jgi:RNA polymerase sigma-70 factor (ECF subfamily)